MSEPANEGVGDATTKQETTPPNQFPPTEHGTALSGQKPKGSANSGSTTSKSNFFKSEQWLRLVQWLIFTVLVALLPIFLTGLSLQAFRQPECPDKHNCDPSKMRIASFDGNDFNSLIAAHGELALVCAAVTADAIGDIFMSKQARTAWTLFAFGWCCVIFFVSAGIFVIAGSGQPNIGLLAEFSIGSFFFTLLSGGACKYYAADDKPRECK